MYAAAVYYCCWPFSDKIINSLLAIHPRWNALFQEQGVFLEDLPRGELEVHVLYIRMNSLLKTLIQCHFCEIQCFQRLWCHNKIKVKLVALLLRQFSDYRVWCLRWQCVSLSMYLNVKQINHHLRTVSQYACVCTYRNSIQTITTLIAKAL